MTFKSKALLLGSAAILLFAALVLGELFPPNGGEGGRSTVMLFPGFKADVAYGMELESADSRVSLKKSGAEWSLDIEGTPYPALKKRIEDLLGEISTLKRGTLVTRSEERAEALGFKENAVRLKVSGAGGELLCDMRAGKTGVTGRGRYIRAAGSREVYETGESLSPYLNADRRFWANLRMFPEDLKTVDIVKVSIKSSLTLSGKKGRRILDYSLVRPESAGTGSWSIVGGEVMRKISGEKAERILDALSGFEASDFNLEAEAAQRTRSNPQAAITLSTGAGRSFTLFVGEGAAGQYPCAVSDGNVGYLAPEWRLEEVLVMPESLFNEGR